MTDVWVITDETHDSRDSCDGLSLRGVFSSLENCFRELIGCNFGREAFESMVWTQVHEAYWEGHNPEHTRCFKICREEADTCLPGDEQFSPEDLAAIQAALATPALS